MEKGVSGCSVCGFCVLYLCLSAFFSATRTLSKHLVMTLLVHRTVAHFQHAPMIVILIASSRQRISTKKPHRIILQGRIFHGGKCNSYSPSFTISGSKNSKTNRQPNGISIGSTVFCTAHPCNQHTHTDRQSHRPRYVRHR